MSQSNTCKHCLKQHNGNYDFCTPCFKNTPGQGRYKLLNAWKKAYKIQFENNQKRDEKIQKLENYFQQMQNEQKRLESQVQNEQRRLESLINKNHKISEEKHDEYRKEREIGESKRDMVDSSEDEMMDSSEEEMMDSSEDELEEEEYENYRFFHERDILLRQKPKLNPEIIERIFKHKKDSWSEENDKKSILSNIEIRGLLFCAYLETEGAKHLLPKKFEKFYNKSQVRDMRDNNSYRFIPDCFTGKITKSLTGRKLNDKIQEFLRDVRKSNFEKTLNKIFKKVYHNQYNILVEEYELKKRR